MLMVRQCELRDARGWTMISWIPESHAIPGCRLSLRLGEGKRTPPMTVVTASQTRLPWAWVAERSRDWRRTRMASDI